MIHYGKAGKDYRQGNTGFNRDQGDCMHCKQAANRHDRNKNYRQQPGCTTAKQGADRTSGKYGQKMIHTKNRVQES